MASTALALAFDQRRPAPLNRFPTKCLQAFSTMPDPAGRPRRLRTGRKAEGPRNSRSATLKGRSSLSWRTEKGRKRRASPAISRWTNVTGNCRSSTSGCDGNGQPTQKSRAPLAGANALLAVSGFRLEFLPPFAYRSVMANTSASSIDQLVASGVDPKTAKAIKKFVETAVKSSVETAV